MKRSSSSVYDLPLLAPYCSAPPNVLSHGYGGVSPPPPPPPFLQYAPRLKNKAHVGSMPLAYRQGKWNEADPLSRRPDSKSCNYVSVYWTGAVPDAGETLDGVHTPPVAAIASMSVSARRLDDDTLDEIIPGYAVDEFYSKRRGGGGGG